MAGPIQLGDVINFSKLAWDVYTFGWDNDFNASELPLLYTIAGCYTWPFYSLGFSFLDTGLWLHCPSQKMKSAFPG